MRRRYNKEYYGDLIHKLNENINDVGIGVDVIIGFPGESEKQFVNTYNFLVSLPVSYLHVFNYSERRNTDAVLLPDKVDVRERKIRSEMLRNLSDKKRFEFYSKFIGTNRKVLFESRKSDDYIEGFTANYIRVKAKAGNEVENSIKTVKLNKADGVKPVIADILD